MAGEGDCKRTHLREVIFEAHVLSQYVSSQELFGIIVIEENAIINNVTCSNAHFTLAEVFDT